VARSNYSFEKRQQELKKKKKREDKALKKQDKEGAPVDDASEYLAMLRGEPFGDDAETDEDKESSDDDGPEIS
jgi:hypothetical protein